MASTITLGPFCTLPAVQVGSDVKIYIDPLNTDAYQIVSTSGGGQPTSAPVASVVVDLYLPTDNINSIPSGGGLYTGTTDANGMVSFTVPDIGV